MQILLPFEIFLERADVSRIVAETSAGFCGILPQRLDCVATSVPGILTYESERDGERYLATDEGVLVKTGPDVVIAAWNAIAGVGITPLVGEIALQVSRLVEGRNRDELFVFWNRPTARTGYESTVQRLLPLDQEWESRVRALPWPTSMIPETLGPMEPTLAKLIQEHLFVSLFRACAESLAAENASRLATMQRAEHNIGEMLERLRLDFNQRRQTSIDEELFDVTSGFEALAQGALGENGELRKCARI